MPLLDQGHLVCCQWIMFTWYALIRSCSLGVLIRLCSLGMSSSALYVADCMVLITQSSLDYVHLACPHEIMFKICMIAKYMDLITHRSTIMSLFTTPKWPASDHVQTMHGCQMHRLDHPYNIFFVYYLQQLPSYQIHHLTVTTTPPCYTYRLVMNNNNLILPPTFYAF